MFFEDISMAELEFRPRVKKTRKRKKETKVLYNVSQPPKENEQYYLGSLNIGASNNVLPETYSTSKVQFLESGEDILIEMDDCSIVVKLTTDTEFLKSKQFALLLLSEI